MSDTTKIPESQWGVHKHHCCKNHGCKYGDKDCPVVLGLCDYYYCEDDQPGDPCFGETPINNEPVDDKYYTISDIRNLEKIKENYNTLVSSEIQEPDAKNYIEFHEIHKRALMNASTRVSPSDNQALALEIVKEIANSGYKIIKIQ